MKNILLLLLTLLTGFTFKKNTTTMFKTTDGKSYKIITLKTNDAFTPSIATAARPYIFLKTGDQNRDAFFTSNPLYQDVFTTVDNDKPIIPIMLSMMLYRVADNLLIFNFSTPFIVELGDIPTIPPFTLIGSPRYTGYAQKIAPFAQRVNYQLQGAGTFKEYIGDINLVQFDKINFHSNDFLTNRPSYLFPTDGQKWYLNYRDFAPVGPVADYNSTAVLTYPIPSVGQSYVLESTLIYAELE